MNNTITFLAELAALMDKYEIDSISSADYILLWKHSPTPLDLGIEIEPKSLLALSEQLKEKI